MPDKAAREKFILIFILEGIEIKKSKNSQNKFDKVRKSKHSNNFHKITKNEIAAAPEECLTVNKQMSFLNGKY